MEADLNKPSSDGETPAFLYLTGDCVYDNGQVADYYAKYSVRMGVTGPSPETTTGKRGGRGVAGRVRA